LANLAHAVSAHAILCAINSDLQFISANGTSSEAVTGSTESIAHARKTIVGLINSVVFAATLLWELSWLAADRAGTTSSNVIVVCFSSFLVSNAKSSR
jgi:hypothetical protein